MTQLMKSILTVGTFVLALGFGIFLGVIFGETFTTRIWLFAGGFVSTFVPVVIYLWRLKP